MERIEGVGIYILLCDQLQETYFTKKGSWAAFCQDNPDCACLNAIRVVVDKSTQKTIRLGWLSEKHMPPIAWSSCQHLVIAIEIKQLNFLNKVSHNRHEKLEA